MHSLHIALRYSRKFVYFISYFAFPSRQMFTIQFQLNLPVTWPTCLKPFLSEQSFNCEVSLIKMISIWSPRGALEPGGRFQTSSRHSSFHQQTCGWSSFSGHFGVVQTSSAALSELHDSLWPWAFCMQAGNASISSGNANAGGDKCVMCERFEV